MMAESALLHRVWRVAISLDTEPPVIGFRRRRIEPVSDLSRPFAHESFTDAVFLRMASAGGPVWVEKPPPEARRGPLSQTCGLVDLRKSAGFRPASPTIRCVGSPPAVSEIQ